MDQGNPHHAKALHHDLQLVKDRVEVFWLPHYCPELNLIERLWKFVKKTVLNSRHQGSFAFSRQRIDQCLAELPTTHRSAIHSLMTLKFQTFEDVSMLAA